MVTRQLAVLIGLGQCVSYCQFCVRRVSHPKSAVLDVSWRRSFLVIKYFAALYLAKGSSKRIVKIEHYLEVVYGHGLHNNVGRPTEVIQSHVNAEGRI